MFSLTKLPTKSLKITSSGKVQFRLSSTDVSISEEISEQVAFFAFLLDRFCAIWRSIHASQTVPFFSRSLWFAKVSVIFREFIGWCKNSTAKKPIPKNKKKVTKNRTLDAFSNHSKTILRNNQNVTTKRHASNFKSHQINIYEWQKYHKKMFILGPTWTPAI